MKAEELEKKLHAGEDMLLLDVREAEEFAGTETLPGANNVPMGRVFIQAAHKMLPKDKKIVTVCQGGVRCSIVARELSQRGYDIDYLEGGMNAWKTKNK